MADPRIRTIKIKTGVVKRTIKEKTSYEKEAKIEEQRNEKFKSEPEPDEHKIRKQNEVIEETYLMIPDTVRRLKKARDDLKNCLETESDLAETEECKEAKNYVEEANKVIEEHESQAQQ